MASPGTIQVPICQYWVFSVCQVSDTHDYCRLALSLEIRAHACLSRVKRSFFSGSTAYVSCRRGGQGPRVRWLPGEQKE
jgi:hypothetical protein